LSSKKKFVLSIIIKGLIYFYIAIAVILLTAILYLMNTWKNLSYAEIVFHLKTTISGTNPEMVRDGILKYGLPAIICIGVIIYSLEHLRKKDNRLGKIAIAICVVLLLITEVAVLYIFNARTNIITTLKNTILGEDESEFIEDNYIDAGDVEIIFPDEKRNLIYIYLESMEMTYADENSGGAFEENVIPNLTALSMENENFSGTKNEMLDGGISLSGTDWTMGAMFAQSSGLPLKVGINSESFENGEADSFFPQITTIGDILQENGYKNVLQIGSEAEFGGRDLFFSTHGDYEIHDYNYAVEQGLIPEDYYVWWGYEDAKLFDFAKKDLLELADSDQPFNYTMLTVDTHFEDGYLCDLCPDDFGENQYANVFACSDQQVYDFIKWIQEQDFYDNTTIVLCGDHITMDGDFCEDVNEDYQRRTYTCIINSAVESDTVDYREYATIDMFPTTLAALGAELSCDRLGLGTNLYSGAQTLIEELETNYVDEEFQKSSPFLESMSGIEADGDEFSDLKENVYLEVADEADKIRLRVFKIFDIYSTALDKVTLVVENINTGEQYEYDAELVEDINGHIEYGVVHSDISYEEVKNLKCTIYISVGNYENYRLKTFTYDMFELWNIDWDVK